MNIPELNAYDDMAINTVVSVINKANEKLGVRQNLFRLAQSRGVFANHAVLSLASLGPPLARTGEKLIQDAITKTWKLKETFQHVLKYIGTSEDECSKYIYFEATFSQPTAAYPIPQVTVAVYFRIENKHTDAKAKPNVHFRIEGSSTDYDVRYVLLTPDWLLAVMKMKMKFFRRLEDLNIF